MLELDRIVAERKPTDDELTAYHEAAHFVMNLIAMGGLPRHLTIEPNEINGVRAMGYCGGLPTSVAYEKEKMANGLPIDPHSLHCSMLIAAAGNAFEYTYGNLCHASGDDLEIHDSLRLMYGYDGLDLDEAFCDFAQKLMSYAAFQKAWDRVAQLLLLYRTLDDDQICDTHEAAHRALGKWHDKLSDKVREWIAWIIEYMSPYRVIEFPVYSHSAQLATQVV